MTTDPRTHNAAIEAAAKLAKSLRRPPSLEGGHWSQMYLAGHEAASIGIAGAIEALRLPNDSQPEPAEGVTGVKVKPLEWRLARVRRMMRRERSATPFGTFTATLLDGCAELSFEADRFEKPSQHPTLEAAKAAAQADYERRILSALTTTGPSVGEAAILDYADDIIWRGEDRSDLNLSLLIDMMSVGVDILSAPDLISHTYVMTDDYDGPSVSVAGTDEGFVAEYHDKTTWVSLDLASDKGAV